MEINKIYQGDSLDILKTFESESVDCVITSPPYWALRDYGVDGQLGLEPTFQEYITKLCDIFDEVKRVLKKEGTCWVNMGDTYGGSGKGVGGKDSKESWTFDKKPIENGIEKSLCQIPARFSIEMCNRGWILRNTIIWKKNNCMPSSADDRFTVDFEYVYFFVKNKKYWFEQIFEPNSEISIKRAEYEKTRKNVSSIGSKSESYGMPARFVKLNPQGHNKRCVWEVNTKGYSGAHFATFPEKLIEPMVKAGCPEKGVCLDPFMGSGTTAVVARKLGRNYLGIELNQKYIDMANKRLAQQVLF
jgi:DNA modification methylase